MSINKKWLSSRMHVKGVLVCAIVLIFIGCAASAKEFNPDIAGPQLIVEPEVISLGIAKLKDTQIVFRGKGFQPEDSVFIKILGVKKDGKVVNVPIADGEVDQKGFFTAKVSTLVKISELLRAKIGSNEKMENIIVVTRPPIATGTYSVMAISMESDKKAECKLLVKGPSLLDRLKDWIGGLLGKIVKK